MSEVEDDCKTFRVIVHYNNEQKCEVEVNSETFKRIQSRDPEALQALLDAYKETKPEPAQEFLCETASSVPSQEYASLTDIHNRSLWNEQSENCLLEAYSKHCSHPQKWKRVEDEMRIEGYTVTAEHCRDRWRKLAKRYQTKRRQQSSGKCDVVIPELWEQCFGSDLIDSEIPRPVFSTDCNTLQTLLKAYEQSRTESNSEASTETNAHVYTFWNLESELLLLESYFRHSHEAQKWKKIEDDFQRNGFIMSAEKCRDKWRRLEKKYQTRQKVGKPAERQSTDISQLWELCFGSAGSESHTSSDSIPATPPVTQHQLPAAKSTSNDNTNICDLINEKDIKPVNSVTEHLQKATAATQEIYQESKSASLTETVNKMTIQVFDQERLPRRGIYLSSLWNEDSENWLLESYIQHCNDTQKWTKVQEDLKKKGCLLSAEQCRDKWRRMERRYQTRWKQILKSGKSKVQIPDLWHKCFGAETSNSQMPSCDFQAGIGVKRKRNASEEPCCDETPKGDGDLSMDEGMTINSEGRQLRKNQRQSTICKLIDYLKSRDQLLIRLHEEHNQILRELVELLKTENKG